MAFQNGETPAQPASGHIPFSRGQSWSQQGSLLPPRQLFFALLHPSTKWEAASGPRPSTKTEYSNVRHERERERDRKRCREAGTQLPLAFPLLKLIAHTPKERNAHSTPLSPFLCALWKRNKDLFVNSDVPLFMGYAADPRALQIMQRTKASLPTYLSTEKYPSLSSVF